MKQNEYVMDKKTNVLLRDEIFNALIKSKLDDLQESGNVIVDKLSSFRDAYAGEDSSIGNLGQIYNATKMVLLRVTSVLQRQQVFLHVQKKKSGIHSDGTKQRYRPVHQAAT